MNCEECGLPMSVFDDAAIVPKPVWYCDGPNSDTTQQGCYATLPYEEEVMQREL